MSMDSQVQFTIEDSPVKDVPEKPTKRGIALTLKTQSKKDCSVTEETDYGIYTSRIKTILKRRKEYLAAELALEEDDEVLESFDEPEIEAKEESFCVVGEDPPERPLSPPPLVASEHLAKRRRRRTKAEIQCDNVIKTLGLIKERVQLQTMSSDDNVNSISSDDDDSVVIESDTEETLLMKFRWRSTIHRVSMKRNQRFHFILPRLSEITGFPVSVLILSCNDTVILPEESPKSLGITVADIIECGVTIPVHRESEAKDLPTTTNDPTIIKLHLQRNDQKNKIILSLRKGQLLSALFEKYSEEAEIPVSQLIFKFDGEELDPDETAENMELEDGFCIDVIVR